MKTQMKAVIASVVVIALALAAVSGVTYSWFSDTEKSNISVTTAVIDVDGAYVDDPLISLTDSAFSSDDSTTALRVNNNKDLSVENMMANVTVSADYTVTNGSSVDVLYRMYVVVEGLSDSFANDVITIEKKESNPLEINTISFVDGIAYIIGGDSGTGSSITLTPSQTSFDYSVVISFDRMVTSSGDFTIKIVNEAYQKGYVYDKPLIIDSTGMLSLPVGNSNSDITIKGTVPVGAGTVLAKPSEVEILFSGGALDEVSDNGNNAVSIEAKMLEPEGSIAKVDFSLIGASTTSFGENWVTVSLTIPGVYSDIDVSYDGVGSQPILIDVSNDGASTFVVFKTNHFSTFIVRGSCIVSSETELRESLKIGGKIVLGADIETTGDSFVNPDYSASILDLNGYGIVAPIGDNAITNYGILTIVDSSGNNSGSITYGIDNEGSGKLYVNSGTLYGSHWINDNTDFGAARAAIYSMGSEVIVHGGQFITPVRAFHVYSGSLEVSGTEDNPIVLTNSTTKWHCIKAGTGTTVELNYVNIESSNGGPVEAAGGTITIRNCNFTQNTDPAVNYSTNVIAASTGGVLNIYDSYMETTSLGIYVYNSGATINVYSGTFKSTSETSPFFQIDSLENGYPATINVEGGSFELSSNSSLLVKETGPNSTLSIQGGSFNINPTGYCKDGFEAITEDGKKWIVKTTN